ncbi:MAG TPA: DUF1905 domain-containing protein [Acidimicrobiales bacterium]|nr:DUF1905 domain-containing protein [Acidimicrobiales bacterium]
MRVSFDGEIWFWRGPSPFHFVTVPEEQSEEIRAVAPLMTYGWGVVPVKATIKSTSWCTSLFPKDARYLVPIKKMVRRTEGLELGDEVPVILTLRARDL